jgi:hypothetical protein
MVTMLSFMLRFSQKESRSGRFGSQEGVVALVPKWLHVAAEPISEAHRCIGVVRLVNSDITQDPTTLHHHSRFRSQLHHATIIFERFFSWETLVNDHSAFVVLLSPAYQRYGRGAEEQGLCNMQETKNQGSQ